MMEVDREVSEQLITVDEMLPALVDVAAARVRGPALTGPAAAPGWGPVPQSRPIHDQRHDDGKVAGLCPC
jgi:hypothetical protein